MRTLSFSLVLGLTCLGAAVFVLPGCGSSITSVCDKVCECEGCNESERSECIDDASDLERLADDRGCSAEFDDYVSCADDELECKDGNSNIDGCSPTLEAFLKCGGGTMDDTPQPGEDDETAGGGGSPGG